MGKILLIVSIVLTGLSAGIGLLNKSKLDEAKKAADQNSGTVTAAKADLTKAQAELATAKKNLDTVSAAKDDLQSQIAGITAEVTTAKNQAQTLSTQITDKQKEIDQLTADLAAAKQAQTSTTTVAPAVVETSDSNEKLAEQATLITTLQQKLDAAQTDVADLRAKEKARQESKMQAGLEGRITAVNKAWNFVILDIGDRNGVVNNAELLVKRGNRLVGKVRITSVLPDSAVADIVANSVPQGTNIALGDNVIYVDNED